MDESNYKKQCALLAEQYHKNIITHREWMQKKTQLFIQKKLYDEETKSKKMTEFKKISRQDECPICYQTVEQNDQLECGHFTHSKCLEQFQESSNKLFYECPICKHEISNMTPEFNLNNENLRCTYEHINGTIEAIVHDDNTLKYWILPKKTNKDLFRKVTQKCFELSEKKYNDS